MDRNEDGTQVWLMELSMRHAQYNQLKYAKYNNFMVRISYAIDPWTMEYKVYVIVVFDNGSTTT